MDYYITKKLKELQIGDYIIGILIVISLIGIYSSSRTKKDKKDNKNTGFIILIISILIYIYFLNNKIKDNKATTSKFLSHLDILATILFIIGILILIYDEFKKN